MPERARPAHHPPLQLPVLPARLRHPERDPRFRHPRPPHLRHLEPRPLEAEKSRRQRRLPPRRLHLRRQHRTRLLRRLSRPPRHYL